MHRSEEALHQKQKELTRTVRRLSQDLSSQAAKLATELGTDAGAEIDQQLKFDGLIMDMLSRSINFNNLLTTHQRKGDDQQLELDRLRKESKSWHGKYDEASQQIETMEHRLGEMEKKFEAAAAEAAAAKVMASKVVAAAPAPVPSAAPIPVSAPIPSAAAPIPISGSWCNV